MRFNLENIRTLPSLLKSLSSGLNKLTFGENFNTFKTEVTIPATTELAIRNELRDVIPSEYFISRQTGNGLITDGTTEWTSDYLYLYNNGAVSATITVRFFK